MASLSELSGGCVLKRWAFCCKTCYITPFSKGFRTTARLLPTTCEIGCISDATFACEATGSAKHVMRNMIRHLVRNYRSLSCPFLRLLLLTCTFRRDPQHTPRPLFSAKPMPQGLCCSVSLNVGMQRSRFLYPNETSMACVSKGSTHMHCGEARHFIHHMLNREAVCIAHGWIGTPSLHLRSCFDMAPLTGSVGMETYFTQQKGNHSAKSVLTFDHEVTSATNGI